MDKEEQNPRDGSVSSNKSLLYACSNFNHHSTRGALPFVRVDSAL